MEKEIKCINKEGEKLVNVSFEPCKGAKVNGIPFTFAHEWNEVEDEIKGFNQLQFFVLKQITQDNSCAVVSMDFSIEDFQSLGVTNIKSLPSHFNLATDGENWVIYCTEKKEITILPMSELWTVVLEDMTSREERIISFEPGDFYFKDANAKNRAFKKIHI